MTEPEDGVEWLDVGPGAGRSARRRTSGPDDARRTPVRSWAALGVVAVALIGTVTLVRAQHGGKPDARGAAPTSLTTAQVPVRDSAPETVSSASTSVLSPPGTAGTSEVPHALWRPEVRHVPTLLRAPGLVLFARSADAVTRIDFGRHTITRTPVPGLDSDGPVAFVALRDRVLVRPGDQVPGYVVRDGAPARPLLGALANGGSVLPGPRDTELWVQDASGTHLDLTDADGHPKRGAGRIPITSDTFDASPDGSGNAILTSVGGVFAADARGVRRIADGMLIATGPTRVLVLDCDDANRCSASTVDLRTGARESVRGTTRAMQGGVLSPDGRVEAGVLPDSRAALLDLRTGRLRRLALVPPGTANGAQRFVWSPDGRWLFAIRNDGQLVAIDPRSGGVTSIGAAVPDVVQLAVRPT